VNYGAQGGTFAATLVITTPTYYCGATCWGFVSGSGLEPGAPVDIYGTIAPVSGLEEVGFADANGNVSFQLYLTCGRNWTDVYAVSTTAVGATITSNIVDSPCG